MQEYEAIYNAGDRRSAQIETNPCAEIMLPVRCHGKSFYDIIAKDLGVSRDEAKRLMYGHGYSQKIKPNIRSNSVCQERAARW